MKGESTTKEGILQVQALCYKTFLAYSQINLTHRLGMPVNIKQRQFDKHSSLSLKAVNYSNKSFITLDPDRKFHDAKVRGLFHKLLMVHLYINEWVGGNQPI